MKLWVASQSQSFQESFVLNLLNEKRSGFYIEIGSNHPIRYSNTYVLERDFGWEGFGFDYSESLVALYNKKRKNRAICCDATRFDFDTFFQLNRIPMLIDYLQLDIEPSIQTLNALFLIPFHRHTFASITFEHDLYADNNNRLVQEHAYSFLTQRGYKRVIKNVMSHGKPFEDWYVHPEIIPRRDYKLFESENIEDYEIFSKASLT